MFWALSVKVQQNAFDIIDYLSKFEHPHPTDEEIWEEIIIPQWRYYYDSAPQIGKIDKICIFPWYNSTLLEEKINNYTDRKIALMIFWKLPYRLSDLDSWINNKSIVYHYRLDAMKYLINQMDRIYNEVIEEYPNGVWVNPYTGKKIPYINFFIAWLTDREIHGLRNGIQQFLGEIGINDEFLPDLNERYIALNPNSINSYFSRNWEEFHLIKYIYGYGIEDYCGPDTHKYYDLYFID